MRVRAVQRGYYLWMRYPGEVFEVPDSLTCIHGKVEGGWQEPVVDEAAPPALAEPLEVDDEDAQWTEKDDAEVEAEDIEDLAKPRKKK